jgi:hypothetical protein
MSRRRAGLGPLKTTASRRPQAVRVKLHSNPSCLMPDDGGYGGVADIRDYGTPKSTTYTTRHLAVKIRVRELWDKSSAPTTISYVTLAVASPKGSSDALL